METFCPGCQQLFAKQIYPTWAKLNSTDILAVDIVPYGNAKEEQQGGHTVNIQYEVENDLLNLVCKTYSGPKRQRNARAFDVAASSRCPRNKTDN
uniref:Zf-TFIIB domain-containing protein n=1 Tax=Macrostomum lignano TaxID=282301 RepID=A0A1I8JME7_9PLAT